MNRIIEIIEGRDSSSYFEFGTVTVNKKSKITGILKNWLEFDIQHMYL